MLTNFRERTAVAAAARPLSRGGIVTSWLESTDSPAEWIDRLRADGVVGGVGGFNVVFGILSRRFVEPVRRQGGDGDDDDEDIPDDGLFVLSNRTRPEDRPECVLRPRTGSDRGQTHGMSNSFYGDRTWAKTVDGEAAVDAAIRQDVENRCRSDGPTDGDDSNSNTDEDAFVADLFRILSTDTLPPPRPDQDFDSFVPMLQKSIFIPVLGRGKYQLQQNAAPPSTTTTTMTEQDSVDAAAATSGLYGTQKQTVVLVRPDGTVTMIERTLYDDDAEPVPVSDQDRRFDFAIDGW